jgi:hypothetical protein
MRPTDGADSLACGRQSWQYRGVKLKQPLALVSALALILVVARSFAAPASGTRLSYRVLSARTEVAPPFAAVDFSYGPREPVAHRGPGAPKGSQWWQLGIRTNADTTTPPLCVVRGLTSTDPLAGQGTPRFIRYQLRIPETGEALEYVEAHSGSALLPPWVDFEHYFIPSPVEPTRRQEGVPETSAFLGQVLSLHSIRHDAGWEAWSDVKKLVLDREVLVGTGRPFKDVESRRLPQKPQPRDYTYTNFVATDYLTMIEAGMNLFLVLPEQEQWVRAEPVFYVRRPQGTPPLRYPADLYRANYLGPAMFMDEPASVMTWDKYLTGLLRHPSDAAALIETRTRVTFESEVPYYSRYWLEEQLRGLGVNFGDMRLAQAELPVWETYYDTAFYEMKGGGSGIVHEGRYQPHDLDDLVARFTGDKRQHTVRQMLQWYYAFLRGGARPFGKFWGTAIYGQCDPAIAPEAFATAYDMGARYFWFWTSDRAHHVPWPEQLALARGLKRYAQEHPRPSIYPPPRKTDKVILMPDGDFAGYADRTWLRDADKASKSEQSEQHRRLMSQMLKAVEECFRRGEGFDISVDDGRPIKGYRRVVRLSERE